MTRHVIVTNSVLAVLLLALPQFTIFIGGCSMPARSQAMIPETMVTDKQHHYSLNLSVHGGLETFPLWDSKISNEAFASTLRASILKSGVFSIIIEGAEAEYRLDVSIQELNQPIIGLDMTVAVKTNWTLQKVDTNELIWTDVISTSYKTPLFDAFFAVERVRLASERAMRENVKQGIYLLSLLDL
jgi:hypothetical protein